MRHKYNGLEGRWLNY